MATLYKDILTVSQEDQQLDLDCQISAAAQSFPTGECIGLSTSDDPATSTRVYFEDSTLKTCERHAVFVNPYTAEVLGQEIEYGSPGQLPFRTALGRMHKNLNLGQAGRLYSELAASWLGPLAVLGLFLWITSRVPVQRGSLFRVQKEVSGAKK